MGVPALLELADWLRSQSVHLAAMEATRPGRGGTLAR